MRRLLATSAALLALLAGAVAPAARANPFLPPAGHVFAGVTGGERVDAFAAQTGRRPAVFQSFTTWGETPDWAIARASRAGARAMLHVSTSSYDGGEAGGEVITPGAIARGGGDAYLVSLNRLLAAAPEPTYVRLMAEMDGHWNPYCAFGPDGRSRGRDHSTAAFRQAWRRTVLIVRGGSVAAIDARLRGLGMAPLRAAAPAATLPRPDVAFQWVPQVAGAPDTPANAPAAYWPGAAYVDWVGTDFYAKFPNFAGLERFYGAFGAKPFVFGEWALWGRDDPGFVHRLFSWMRAHPRVRMAMYNQGNNGGGPFRLKRYPRATAALRAELGAPRFTTSAP